MTEAVGRKSIIKDFFQTPIYPLDSVEIKIDVHTTKHLGVVKQSTGELVNVEIESITDSKENGIIYGRARYNRDEQLHYFEIISPKLSSDIVYIEDLLEADAELYKSNKIGRYNNLDDYILDFKEKIEIPVTGSEDQLMLEANNFKQVG